MARKSRSSPAAFLTSPAALPDRGALESLIDRTVFAGAGGARPARLADYLAAARLRLGETPLEAVMEARLDWPEAA